MPGAVIAVQTFGDLLGFNPHCHVFWTDGCFDEKALFRVVPRFAPEGLKTIYGAIDLIRAERGQGWFAYCKG
jgi:hypothetical protein